MCEEDEKEGSTSHGGRQEEEGRWRYRRREESPGGGEGTKWNVDTDYAGRGGKCNGEEEKEDGTLREPTTQSNNKEEDRR